MVANKHITKIVVAVMAAAVVLCLLAMAFSDRLTQALGGTGVRMEYEYKLFDTDELISIDILMDEDSWNKMLSNATSEEYYVCSVVINGTRLDNVAIRPKGNTSLSAIAMDANSDRFSFKLEFDHFVEGQTCFGLDKLILNNNYADATWMKEALVYDMYQYLGADASLYNYAEISVNGEYWGVYLALEAVEQSFMLRNYGTQEGELYKPDSMGMGGGGDKKSGSSMPDAGSFDMSGLPDMGSFDPGSMPDMGSFDMSSLPDMGSFDPGSMPDMDSFDMSGLPDMGSFDPGSPPDTGSSAQGGAPESESGGRADGSDSRSSRPSGGFSFGGGFSGGGANLNYTDDELDSYSTIWDGEVTKTGKNDHRRVVTALKNISEGNDLEKYLDVDNVLKYMAVHTFAVNMDSLSGSMAHNYYLYEYDGQLNILPWDYNLSFGGMFSSGDATSMVNDAIDTPFSGTRFFDALLENEEYLARYHSYLQQLVDEYVGGGRFDQVYDRIRGQIDALVEEDPSAAYTFEEYETAANVLYEVIQLRARSIGGQLDGTIPSTDSGQKQDPASLIDASHIDVESMGQFDMGGGGGGFVGFGRGGGRPGKSDRGDAQAGDTERSAPDSGQTPGGSASDSLPEGPDGEGAPDTGSFRPGNMPGGSGSGMPDMGSFSPGNMPGASGGGMPDMGSFSPGNMPGGSGGGMPDMGSFSPGNMPGGSGGFTAPGQGGSGESDAESSNLEAQPSGGGKERPSSFSGMPGQSSEKTEVSNLLYYGICLAVMLAALIAVSLVKRRKQR